MLLKYGLGGNGHALSWSFLLSFFENIEHVALTSWICVTILFDSQMGLVMDMLVGFLPDTGRGQASP